MTEEKIPPRREETRRKEAECEEYHDALDDDLDGFYPCKEDFSKEEKATDLLDALFGSLPPGPLLTYEMKFRRPRGPKKKHKPSQIFPSVDYPITSADMVEPGDQVTETAEKMEALQMAVDKPLYMRIGGMLVLPMPVSGPLFSKEEKEK